MQGSSSAPTPTLTDRERPRKLTPRDAKKSRRANIVSAAGIADRLAQGVTVIAIASLATVNVNGSANACARECDCDRVAKNVVTAATGFAKTFAVDLPARCTGSRIPHRGCAAQGLQAELEYHSASDGNSSGSAWRRSLHHQLHPHLLHSSCYPPPRSWQPRTHPPSVLMPPANSPSDQTCVAKQSQDPCPWVGRGSVFRSCPQRGDARTDGREW